MASRDVALCMQAKHAWVCDMKAEVGEQPQDPGFT
jgi:hypothetical protein